LDGVVEIPGRELAGALAGARRLPELVRLFGEHLLANSSAEAFEAWWFNGREPARWERAEFRIPGARTLDPAMLATACNTIEAAIGGDDGSSGGRLLTGYVPQSEHQARRADDSQRTGYAAIQADAHRWLVVFLREPVHAFKQWQAGWIKRDGRMASVPESLLRELRAADLSVALDSFAGHVRRQFEIEQARTELYRDSLTGLYNMRYLELALDLEVRRASRFGTTFCVLFVDVDGFKKVNDTHGHLAGSALLSEMGAVIKDAVREVDVVARYGGDEFVLVLLGASVETGKMIAERVREVVAAQRFVTAAGKDVYVTVSIGLAAFPESARSREQLLRMADETMYASKNSGKNRVTVFAPLGGVGAGDGASPGEMNVEEASSQASV
jgi:diguanylate cyclase (GGDEF)-like protein